MYVCILHIQFEESTYLNKGKLDLKGSLDWNTFIKISP